MSILIDPKGNHSSCNPPLAGYIALFIENVVEAGSDVARCWKWIRTAAPDHCTPVGSPTSRSLLRQASSRPCFAATPRNPSLALWHINGELACANEDYRHHARGKPGQRVTCGCGGKLVQAQWLEALPFERSDDYMTLHIDAGFPTQTPAGVSGSGRPLGHATGPVKFDLVAGSNGGGEQIGPNTFRTHPGHLGLSENIMIRAYRPGDRQYASAKQACEVKHPKMITVGKPQTISFSAIPDQRIGVAQIPLRASSSLNRQVELYVTRGPAEVTGNTLRLTAVPPRTKVPVKITVLAHQWRTAIGPGVWSATPVEQTFLLIARAASTR